MTYIKNPVRIEERSFEIIGDELGDQAKCFTKEELMIVKRVIHTTADFEYAELIDIHEDAIQVAKELLQKGSSIYADTTMIISGVNKRKLGELNGTLYNFVHDSDVYAKAEAEGITRSMAGIIKAVEQEHIDIFAIGNAPTAIYQLKELIEQTQQKPKLIIAAPVGFVGAAESKELVTSLGIPYIRITGRKGGSTVVVAIINALLKMV